MTVNLAASKDIWGDKASITASVSDLFNSRRRESTTRGQDIMVDGTAVPSFVQNSEFQWRQRQFIMTFVYRFNQKKDRRDQRGDDNGGDLEFEG